MKTVRWMKVLHHSLSTLSCSHDLWCLQLILFCHVCFNSLELLVIPMHALQHSFNWHPQNTSAWPGSLADSESNKTTFMDWPPSPPDRHSDKDHSWSVNFILEIFLWGQRLYLLVLPLTCLAEMVISLTVYFVFNHKIPLDEIFRSVFSRKKRLKQLDMLILKKYPWSFLADV